MTLKELGINQSAVIIKVGGEGALRQHFLDMGVIPGASVTVVKLAPMGDPMELEIHGYELTLRLADADKIEVAPVTEGEKESSGQDNGKALADAVKGVGSRKHPGLGEGGIFHSRESEKPLPEGTLLTYALVGNQNCGKTTLFNIIAGLYEPDEGEV